MTNGLRLFTNLRKDMKTYLLDIDDKRLLNKRSLIESVFNVLKKHMHLERTRHRFLLNFFVHIISSLTSFSSLNLSYLICPYYHASTTTLLKCSTVSVRFQWSILLSLYDR
ncbi:transposase DDE domain protein [Orientia tsutsugamushi str. UT144]|uniref:Transposase DDE domain protein n=1 Tax=Orientia tsutsugamushi str. UT144 TaxID=1441384 RepID=A0A0F3RMC9_ORITS|nr:transposase DDE domain protein [Orientia tsutsugamushi str. UT144]